MNIKLGEDYMIKSDSLNYILYKRHLSDPTHRFSKGEVKETWDVLGYFPKLNHLVNYLIEKEILESEVDSLRSMVNLIDYTSKYMVAVLDMEVKSNGKA